MWFLQYKMIRLFYILIIKLTKKSKGKDKRRKGTGSSVGSYGSRDFSYAATSVISGISNGGTSDDGLRTKQIKNSIVSTRKNKIAVLVGDYMLSRILLLSIEKRNMDLLEIVARAVQEMSEGELLQIEKARHLDITEEVYYEVIRKKTASLIATCCEAGALSVDAHAERAQMRQFGELIGLAFQIKDDIFDYGTGEHIGKPTGIDIREQKLTLPLIYALQNAQPAIQKELRYIIKNEYDVSNRVQRAIELVWESGGVQYAQKRMEAIAADALNILAAYPDSPAKASLIGLVAYTMNREK